MWIVLRRMLEGGLRRGIGRGLLPMTAQALPAQATMPHRTDSYFHLHLISDSTGETLTTVARAATAQYTKVMPGEHVYPLVRTEKQLDRVLAEIEESPGIVLYTLLVEDLVRQGANPRHEASAPR